MRVEKMTFESGEQGWWPRGETDPLPQGRLHRVLRWILDQMNAGCVQFIGDGGAQPAHTVVIGKGAAFYASAEEAAEEVQKRLLAVNIAGVFATARERGVEPEHRELTEKVRRLSDEGGAMNTDFHYAYQLVDILERISTKTFVFEAPPIVGWAERQTMDLLQEATRCYLFGLYRACVAVCRTALEDSLNQRVPPSSLMEERMQSGEPDGLKPLIDAAVRAGVLPKELRGMAHGIRQKANAVLHHADHDVGNPWELLLRTRTIVEKVHTRSRTT